VLVSTPGSGHRGSALTVVAMVVINVIELVTKIALPRQEPADAEGGSPGGDGVNL
jgi:hypothetical protein